MTLVWIPDLNKHKILRTLASNFSKNYVCFEKPYQTLEKGFHRVPKHLEIGLKNSAAPRFFNTLLGVWMYPDETLFLVFDVIYQTRERVFHQDIQTPRSGLKKRGAAEFFNRVRGVWIPDETLFRVFDMASQTIHNSWRNSRQKFAKLYAN